DYYCLVWDSYNVHWVF
nr:immunoglobulin light chain junction region [Macaca mulatta]MOW14991.1 immunoglobulin light chain junction region [Macaca mulatta]MOW15079.1 immunoglobulin light chain junction region [Macaca mulatta]MOW15189.1 immunoglobulin light chain junction region [Macaca mulatta]MOW15333.1 immunoglobulin light chain junction region [Macaca mulatta]